MPRHKLTTREMLEGVRKALASPNTPKEFIPSLKRREEFLSEVILEEMDAKARRKRGKT